MDTNTLQRIRFTSRSINRLIMENNLSSFNAQLEMVQLRFVFLSLFEYHKFSRYSNGMYACKCLPYREKPVEDKFEELNKAVQYLQARFFYISL